MVVFFNEFTKALPLYVVPIEAADVGSEAGPIAFCGYAPGYAQVCVEGMRGQKSKNKVCVRVCAGYARVCAAG